LGRREFLKDEFSAIAAATAGIQDRFAGQINSMLAQVALEQPELKMRRLNSLSSRCFWNHLLG